MTKTDWSKPLDVDAATATFPGRVSHLMPSMNEIPEEFGNWPNSNNIWERLVADWFFTGIKNLKLTPKEGVDEQKAMRHIKTILGSFEPKHEHKEMACAYLLSLWFTDASWERINKT